MRALLFGVVLVLVIRVLVQAAVASLALAQRARAPARPWPLARFLPLGKPPSLPLRRLARAWAADLAAPPKRPSATACGFFFIGGILFCCSLRFDYGLPVGFCKVNFAHWVSKVLGRKWSV